MDRAARVKVQALLMIFLLTGSEAVRLQHGSRSKNSHKTQTSNSSLEDGQLADPLAADGPSTYPGARVVVEEMELTGTEAKAVKDQKEKCSWRLRHGGCSDPCTFRPLPLDRRLSDSCRLSVDHMVQDDDHIMYYVDLEGKLLAEKAAAFSDNCPTDVGVRGTFSKHTWRCVRRAAYMVQVVQFLSAAQEKLINSTSARNPVILEQAVENAQNKLTSVLGDSAPYYAELSRKVQSNAVDFVKTPTSMMKELVNTVADLLSNNTTARGEAQKNISALRIREDPAPTVEEVAEITATAERFRSLSWLRNKEKRSWKSVERKTKKSLEVQEESKIVAAALLEQDVEDAGRKKSGNSILFLLLCVLVFLVLLTLIHVLFQELALASLLGGTLAWIVHAILVVLALMFVLDAWNKGKFE